MMYLAFFLKPLVALLLFAFFVYPIAWLMNKLIPEGRLKRLLFRRIR